MTAEPSLNPKHSRYAPLIDLTRCAAALLVLVYHTMSNWPHKLMAPAIFTAYPDPSRFTPVTYSGFVGVQIFFVISGYVIASSCHGRRPSEFFVGRALRIIPLLWVGTSIAVIIHLLYGAPLLPTALSALNDALLNPRGGWLNPVVWTLTVESAFYALVFLGLLVRAADIETYLCQLAVGLLLISGAFNLLCLASGWVNGSYWPSVLLLRHGACFSLGIAIWATTSGNRRLDWTIPFSLIVGVVEIHQWIATKASEGGVMPTWLPAAIWLLAIGVVFYGARRTVSSVRPWVRTAGLITFPIYLIHIPVSGVVILAALRLGVPFVPAVLCGAGAVVVLAWALVRFVEPALRPWFRQALERLARALDVTRALALSRARRSD